MALMEAMPSQRWPQCTRFRRLRRRKRYPEYDPMVRSVRNGYINLYVASDVRLSWHGRSIAGKAEPSTSSTTALKCAAP